MSAPKFTPGPWRYSDLAVYTDDADARDRVIIAELCGPGVTADRVAEYRANGHLLAAAPELYAALEDLLAQLDRGININTVECYAALAKARGEG